MSSKTIWIFNHYATTAFVDANGRHYMLAKYLVEWGYTVYVFCASTLHNSEVNLIDKDDPNQIIERVSDGIHFVFLKTSGYQGNGRARLKNIYQYYRGLKRNYKRFPKPDVIIGSSVHPLACYAAIKLSRRIRCKVIVEIRDLWPASLEAYGYIKSSGIIAKALYRFERWLYERADAVVFTMPGGKQYLIDRRWDENSGGHLSLDKVFYINNGVDIPTFKHDLKSHTFHSDLIDGVDTPIVMYAGSVRRVNHLITLVDAADKLREEKVAFVVIGDGDELEMLKRESAERGLENIFFIGRIDKACVPSALSKATIVTALSDSGSNSLIASYGNSNNKVFEYLASGKPLLINSNSVYSIVNEFSCGIEKSITTSADYASTVLEMLTDVERLREWGQNAQVAANFYSYEKQAKRLVGVIDFVLVGEES